MKRFTFLAVTLLASAAMAQTAPLRVNGITSANTPIADGAANPLSISSGAPGVASALPGKRGGALSVVGGNGAASAGFGGGDGSYLIGLAGFGGDSNVGDPVVTTTGAIPSSTAGNGGNRYSIAGRGGAGSANNIGGAGGFGVWGAGSGGLGSSAQNGGDGKDAYFFAGSGGAAATTGALGGVGGDLYIDAGLHGYGRPDGNIYIGLTVGASLTLGAPTVQTNKSIVNTNKVYGVSLQNNNLSANGFPQWSPGLELTGYSWSTGSVASQQSKWLVQGNPSDGASVGNKLQFYSSENGVAYASRGFIDNFGNISAAADLYTSGGNGIGIVRAAQLQPNTAATAMSIGTSNTSGITMGTGVTTTLGGVAVTNSIAFNGGATASGATDFDLSGGSGKFKPPSGGINAASTTTVINGGLSITEAFRPHGRTVADVNATLASTDTYLGYTTITAARVVAVSCVIGTVAQPAVFIVKDQSGTASGTNTITVTPSAGTIDGSASLVCVNSARGSCRFIANGANCFTF